MVREYSPQNKGKDLWSDHPISCLEKLDSSVSVVGGQFCCSTEIVPHYDTSSLQLKVRLTFV